MQVNVHEAKSQLSKLLEAVERGETVTIARNGKPVAELVKAKKRVFPFGIAKDDPLVAPGDESLWAPMSDEEVDAWLEGR